MNLNGKNIIVRNNIKEIINYLYSKGYYWTGNKNSDIGLAIEHFYLFNYSFICIDKYENIFYFQDVANSEKVINMNPLLRKYKLNRILKIKSK